MSGAGWSFVAVAVTAAVASAQPAPARVPPVDLEYTAPAECPDEISVRAGIIVRLGFDPFHGGAARRAFVDITKTASGYAATIELREPGREPSRRALAPTATCEDLTAALEVALAVVIEPPAAAPTPSPTPTLAPAPGNGPGATRATYQPPGWTPQPPKPKKPPKHEIAIMFGAVAGPHPNAEGYGGLRAGYLIGTGYRVGLVGRLSNGDATIGRDRDVSTSTSELAAEACVRKPLVIACGVVGFGSKSVVISEYQPEMFGRVTLADYSKVYGLAGASVSLDVPLGGAFIRPTVEASIPLPRVDLTVSGVKQQELQVVHVGFDLALGYRW